MTIRIKKGLDIPLEGAPKQELDTGNRITRVASVGRDFVGLKPKMEVAVGDQVKLGQPLFTDRKKPGVRFVAPGTGKVVEINRGERRILQSVVIELDDPDGPYAGVEFNSWPSAELAGLTSEQVRETMLESGLWVGMRSRPYNKVPMADASPAAIFVTAIDTNPLAPDPQIAINRQSEAFKDGITVLSRLADVPLYVCVGDGADIPVPDVATVKTQAFSGPHPAGLVGTHIHFLHPCTPERPVWSIGYQDVIAIGKLFTTGQLWTERVIALTGALVNNPRLVTTRVGAYTEDLVAGEVEQIQSRVVAGNVLSGRRAAGWGAYLGRHHNQVTVLPEPTEREFMGWIVPGLNKYSGSRVFLSRLFKRGSKFALNTSQNGSPRAMVPIGAYESVMPQDMLPTQLLRALLVQDTVAAQELGCMELAEEDLALCSFVCPSKYDYGPALRANLELIEKEG